MMMNLLKKLKTFLALAFVMGFLFSATLTSCGNKNTTEDSTEQSEIEVQGDSAEVDEHPTGDDEHPNN